MVLNKYGRKEEKHKVCAIFIIEEMLQCAGIGGIFMILNDIPGITFSVPVVLSVSTFVCIALYASGIWKRQWRVKCTVGTTILCCCAGMIWRTSLLSQAGEFLRSLTGSATERETDVTLFMVFASVLTAIVFYLSEIICRNHLLPYLTVTAVTAGGPLFGIRTEVFPMLWGLAFQILFWTVRTADWKDKKSFDRKGISATSSAAVRAAAFAGIALAISVCGAVVITSIWGDSLSSVAYSGEGFISRSLRQISGSAENPAADGHISSGNNYRTGETQMTVTLTEEPTEPLYLKGFTGGEYIGGEWKEADDTALFHEMAQILDWEEWESWIGGLYYNLYFSMNAAGEKNHDEDRRIVFVRFAEGADPTAFFVPYNSVWLDLREYDRAGTGYGYQYYEEEEMDIDWENVPEDFKIPRDWYRQVQQAYLQVIPEAYTEVPETLLPRLTVLCQDRSFRAVDEVTAFILSTLRSNASYTLTPGRVPLNEDVVEYFLFESHEGYCVHFASAAALMYRLCGVPARYASGYMLQPSDFTRQEDGTWQTEVTDESAHAWTEIFLEDYGWVPVDMTPSSDGQDFVTYPGLDSAVLEEMTASVSGTTGVEESGGESSDLASDTASRMEGTGKSGSWADFFESDQYPEMLRILSVILCEGLILTPAVIDGYRVRKKRKEEQMSCRQLFSALLSVLHRNGYMTDYTGNEIDFAVKLAKEIPCIKKKEAERLVDIVSRAAYGMYESKKEEDKYVHDIYSRICGWIRKRDRHTWN